MAREYLMMLEETAYGVPNLTAGAGTAPTAGKFDYFRLDGDNAFTMRPVKNTIIIPHGGGLSTPAIRVGNRATMVGTLTTDLYFSQAERLLKWATDRIDTGRTVPWTTTDASAVMPPGDLASMSFYHAYDWEDGTTIARRAYRGTKCTSLRLESTSDGERVRATFGLVAQKPTPNDALGGADSTAINATEFPLAALGDYPTDPVLFTHSSGGLKIGSVRTEYERLNIEITNNLAPYHGENLFLTRCLFTGRQSRLGTKLVQKLALNDRAAYEALTEQDCHIVFDDGTTTITLDFHGENEFDTFADDFPLNGIYQNEFTLINLIDPAIPGDISVTVAPSA